MRSESESSSSANVTERQTDWNVANWCKANRIVRNLRRRIFRASVVEVSDLLEPCAFSGASTVLVRREVACFDRRVSSSLGDSLFSAPT